MHSRFIWGSGLCLLDNNSQSALIVTNTDWLFLHFDGSIIVWMYTVPNSQLCWLSIEEQLFLNAIILLISLGRWILHFLELESKIGSPPSRNKCSPMIWCARFSCGQLIFSNLAACNGSSPNESRAAVLFELVPDNTDSVLPELSATGKISQCSYVKGRCCK